MERRGLGQTRRRCGREENNAGITGAAGEVVAIAMAVAVVAILGGSLTG